MFKNLLFLIVALFIFTSCDDHDADGHSDGHFEPTRWVFELNDVNYLEINNGVVTTNYNSSFDLTLNQDLGTFEIYFYDENGNEVELDDDEMYISWTISDNSIVEFQSLDDENDEFIIKPLKSGSTEVTFYVYHGDHPDITSPTIQINVN